MNRENIKKAFALISAEVRDYLLHNKSVLNNYETFKTALNAYNQYQEDVHDGVDRVFDLNLKEDIIDLIIGGATLSDLAEMNASKFCFCHFGQNYEKAVMLSNQDVETLILNNADSITQYALMFSNDDKAYSEWLAKFMADCILSDHKLYFDITNDLL